MRNYNLLLPISLATHVTCSTLQVIGGAFATAPTLSTVLKACIVVSMTVAGVDASFHGPHPFWFNTVPWLEW